MKAKTLKTINGVFWAIATVAINTGVAIVWEQQASSPKSIALGCILFTSLCAGFWYIIHNYINEVNK